MRPTPPLMMARWASASTAIGSAGTHTLWSTTLRMDSKPGGNTGVSLSTCTPSSTLSTRMEKYLPHRPLSTSRRCRTSQIVSSAMTTSGLLVFSKRSLRF
eukprot:Rmarinus@m.11036